MLIRIGKFDITECWDGVFYKKLSRYRSITFLLLSHFQWSAGLLSHTDASEEVDGREEL